MLSLCIGLRPVFVQNEVTIELALYTFLIIGSCAVVSLQNSNVPDKANGLTKFMLVS